MCVPDCAMSAFDFRLLWPELMPRARITPLAAAAHIQLASRYRDRDRVDFSHAVANIWQTHVQPGQAQLRQSSQLRLRLRLLCVSSVYLRLLVAACVLLCVNKSNGQMGKWANGRMDRQMGQGMRCLLFLSAASRIGQMSLSSSEEQSPFKTAKTGEKES